MQSILYNQSTSNTDTVENVKFSQMPKSNRFFFKCILPTLREGVCYSQRSYRIPSNVTQICIMRLFRDIKCNSIRLVFFPEPCLWISLQCIEERASYKASHPRGTCAQQYTVHTLCMSKPCPKVHLSWSCCDNQNSPTMHYCCTFQLCETFWSLAISPPFFH